MGQSQPVTLVPHISNYIQLIGDGLLIPILCLVAIILNVTVVIVLCSGKMKTIAKYNLLSIMLMLVDTLVCLFELLEKLMYSRTYQGWFNYGQTYTFIAFRIANLYCVKAGKYISKSIN